jgi:hypothetical protein
MPLDTYVASLGPRASVWKILYFSMNQITPPPLFNSKTKRKNGFLLPWIGHDCREASCEGASRGYSAMQPQQRVGTRTQGGGALLASDVMVAACSAQVEVAGDARWGSEVRCRGSVAACGPRIGQHVGGVCHTHLSTKWSAYSYVCPEINHT